MASRQTKSKPKRKLKEGSGRAKEYKRRKLRTKCCPKTFTAPANRTGRKVVRRTPGRRRAGEEFDMLATFDASPPPCACGCCEYRQQVRGEFTFNGRPFRHMLGGGPMSKTAFQEDSLPDGRTYGYRAGAKMLSGANDRYLPNRADGCEYQGHDFPSMTGAPGKRFSIDLEFRGQLVDTCDGDQVLMTRTWTIKFSGRLSRRQKYWDP